MDIKVRTDFYCLKMLDGKFRIFRREQVVGPYVKVEQLSSLEFEHEADAQTCVNDLLSKTDEVKHTTL